MSGAPKRQRLGRGLGALLGEGYLAPSIDDVDVRNVALGSISVNPFQPRREFSDEDLSDLTNSIRENGLLQPLVVRPDPDRPGERFQLVAGERRLRALKSLGRVAVPAVIRDVDDRTLLVLALVENIQRAALTPLDEARGYQSLSSEFGLTQAEIAESVGKDRSSVANTIRLLKLPASLQKLLAAGELGMGHARALLAIGDAGRMVEVGRRAAAEGWTVRDVEQHARTRTRARPPSKRPQVSEADPMTRALQEALREALGARVTLKASEKGVGTVEVPFHSPEDFERVFHLLTGREVSEVAG